MILDMLIGPCTRGRWSLVYLWRTTYWPRWWDSLGNPTAVSKHYQSTWVGMLPFQSPIVPLLKQRASAATFKYYIYIPSWKHEKQGKQHGNLVNKYIHRKTYIIIYYIYEMIWYEMHWNHGSVMENMWQLASFSSSTAALASLRPGSVITSTLSGELTWLGRSRPGWHQGPMPHGCDMMLITIMMYMQHIRYIYIYIYVHNLWVCHTMIIISYLGSNDSSVFGNDELINPSPHPLILCRGV